MSASALYLALLADTGWYADAACRPTRGRNLSALFIPEGDGRSGSRKEADARFDQALEICAFCTVRPQCRAAAVADDTRFGVWGGELLGKGMWSNKRGRSAGWKPLRRVS